MANSKAGGAIHPDALASALRAHGAETEVFLPGQELEPLLISPPDRIVVAGGDGSIARAAGLAAEVSTPLAVIPTGTANDFAASMELPLGLREACRLAVLGTELLPMDLGRLSDERPFVNIVNVGVAVAAAREAAMFKSRIGPAAYALGALRAAAGADPVRCRIRVDGEDFFHGNAWQVMIAVTGAFGGGSGVDCADPSDGRADVLVLPANRRPHRLLRTTSRLALARRAWGMRKGTIAAQTDVPHTHARTLEIQLTAGTHLNVDGDVFPAGMPECVTIHPHAYTLVRG